MPSAEYHTLSLHDALPISVQIDRVIDVVRHAASRHPKTCVSIDTTSAEVAAACLDAGAHAVNDISLLSEEELADRKSTRLNSSHLVISYAVFCLKKKKTKT